MTLRLPNATLSPNARPNRYTKARATKEARHWAMWCATSELRNRGMEPPRWLSAEVRIAFYFRENRTRDRDNALASMKAYFDGIADAGIVTNDAGLVLCSPEMNVDSANPRVEIEVREMKPETGAAPPRNASVNSGNPDPNT